MLITNLLSMISEPCTRMKTAKPGPTMTSPIVPRTPMVPTGVRRV
jgi:hypothetical protein